MGLLLPPANMATTKQNGGGAMKRRRSRMLALAAMAALLSSSTGCYQLLFASALHRRGYPVSARRVIGAAIIGSALHAAAHRRRAVTRAEWYECQECGVSAQVGAVHSCGH